MFGGIGRHMPMWPSKNYNWCALLFSFTFWNVHARFKHISWNSIDPDISSYSHMHRNMWSSLTVKCARAQRTQRTHMKSNMDLQQSLDICWYTPYAHTMCYVSSNYPFWYFDFILTFYSAYTNNCKTFEPTAMKSKIQNYKLGVCVRVFVFVYVCMSTL